MLALVLVLWNQPATAQSNFEGAQLGGRTTMMGGATVATGADEATAFVNPAGITRIPGQSFSFSTFAVNLAYRHIESPLDPSGTMNIEQPDASKVSLRVIPNTFCLFLDGPPRDHFSGRSRHKYSLCAAATEREKLKLTQNRFEPGAGGSFQGVSQSTEVDFVRSTVALSWGISLDKSTSLGVTLRTDNTRFQDYSTGTSFGAEGSMGSYQAVSLARETWSWDTSLIIGLTSNISRVVTLGAALTTPSQHIVGKYTSQAMVSLGTDRGYGVLQDDGDFRYNHPGSLRLGMAFSWPRFTVEVNGSFYGPQSQRARANFDRRLVGFDPDNATETELGRGSVSEKGRAVTNLSLGAEYFLSSDFSVLGGMGTDFSGLHKRQDQELGEVLFRQRRDGAFASLGVSSYGRRGRLLLGLVGQYSWGQVLIADPSLAVPSFVALPQSLWSFSFVISGQINFTTVAEVAERAATPLTNLGSDPPKSQAEEK
jgi:hypothetical protein